VRQSIFQIDPCNETAIQRPSGDQDGHHGVVVGECDR
jgi:hypothetical protein